MSRKIATLFFLAIGILSWLAFSLLDFNANPLDLLPENLPQVQAIRDYEEQFAAQNDIIIALEHPDPERLEAISESVVSSLRNHTDLFAKVSGNAPWDENPAAMSELLAYIWFNGPPEELLALEEKLQPSVVATKLEDSFDSLANSHDIVAITRAAHDPAGLTDFGAKETFQLEGVSQLQFRSPGGDLQILLAQPASALTEPKTLKRWIQRVEALIADWRAAHPELSEDTKINLTGRMIYILESTKDLRRDLALSVLVTLAFIVTVFWLLYRRLRPLLWLLICLYLTFIVTVILGKAVYAQLSAMSVGFAAILMGLTVDYGFLIYQESITSRRDPRELRPIFIQTIGWAALTTACVFCALNLSSMRGAAQLGTMVAIGISVGAIIMVGLYAFLLSAIQPRHEINQRLHWISRPLLAQKNSSLWLLLTLVLGAGAAGGLLLQGAPEFSYKPQSLQPSDRQDAYQRFLDLREKLGGAPAKLLVSSDSDEGMIEALDASAKVLSEQPGVAGFTLPHRLWPHVEGQQRNVETLKRLITLESPLLEQARDTGFSEESFELTQRVFATWREMAASPPPYRLHDPASLWLTERIIANRPSNKMAIGFVRMEDEELTALPADLCAALEKHGTRAVGWGYLTPSIVEILRHDLRFVVLPTCAILLAMLAIVFRSIRGVALSLATLGFSALILLGLMRLFGIEWNIVNFMAIPLLLGAGIDYSIHVILALRRTGGDVERVQQNIGKALLLCGATTAVGFGSLKWSKYGGIPSFGVVCALGILATMLTAVFLLPHWWRFAHRTHKD